MIQLREKKALHNLQQQHPENLRNPGHCEMGTREKKEMESTHFKNEQHNPGIGRNGRKTMTSRLRGRSKITKALTRLTSITRKNNQ